MHTNESHVIDRRSHPIRLAIVSGLLVICMIALSAEVAGALSLDPGTGVSDASMDELTRVFADAANPLRAEHISFLEENVLLPGYGDNVPFDGSRLGHHSNATHGPTAY